MCARSVAGSSRSRRQWVMDSNAIPHLEASTLPALFEVWEDATGLARGALTRGNTRFVERLGFDAAVTVTLDGARVVVAPHGALAVLEAMPAALLHDTAAIEEALSRTWIPEAVGTAELWYRDSPVGGPDDRVSRVTETDAAAMRQAVTAEEWDEADLADMEYRWVVRDPGGTPLAIAGFTVWMDRVGQIGVITHGDHRGQGHAERVGRFAVNSAISMGLIAQWRTRVGNDASSKLAHALGFTQLGLQSTVALEED